jgi:hypothetical protein
MSITENPDNRETFAAIADFLIPNAAGMPSASEVEVQGPILDRILSLRTDLRDDFLRGISRTVGLNGHAAADLLNREDPTAFAAVSLVASAAYYMSDRVRSLIGYPGQENRPDPDPDAVPEYVRNGMLQQVLNRGPIFKPTP